MSSNQTSSYSLPDHELLKKQAEWLSEARSRILRNASIGQRNRVLDLGSGFGVVTSELIRRANGPVIALDINLSALKSSVDKFISVCADAIHLPFQASTFDLVFTQNAFLWIRDPQKCLKEIKRVLNRNGAAVFMEPDYGGLMEYPPEIELQSVWIPALQRAGADPLIGRKLTSWLPETGWSVQAELLPRLAPPSIDRFKLLEELPLTDENRSKVASALHSSQKCDPQTQIAHLPYFLIIAAPRS